MQVKLISAQTAFEAAKLTLKQIDTTDLEMQNLVVVPDAFSLQAENLIFDTLGIKATFNIEVVGISRLASKILRDAGVPLSRISGLEEVFCLYQAVQLCKEDFEYFKGCGLSFCQQVLKVVKQFKGCKISPDKIKPTGDENLDKKMHDLRLIYEKYDALLGEKLDLSRLLEFFLEKTENEINLSKINLFFVNFDSFSTEIGSFIIRLAGRVNKTFIGMAEPKKLQKNAFIYEDDIKRKVTLFAKEFGEIVPVEQNFSTLVGPQLAMAENLFAFDIAPSQHAPENFFTNIVPKNRQEEVEIVAKLIKFRVANGAHFKDFALAVADEKYFKIINQVFDDFAIAKYSDEAADLSETLLGHFLQKILEIAKRNFVLSDFIFLATSTLLGGDEEVVRKVEFFQIDTAEEFVAEFEQFRPIVNCVQNMQKAEFLRDFVAEIETILQIVKPKFEKAVKCIGDEKFFKTQSENSQSWELIWAVLEKLRSLGGEARFDLQSFETLLLFALKSVKVETIPTYIDAVYVGLATESYFSDVPTLFVLGANAAAIPSLQADTGIIADADIKKLSLNFALEPEIKVLNRRKRLKLFELLQHAKEQLVVCSPLNVDGAHQDPSEFVDDLATLFGKNTLHSDAFEVFDSPLFSAEQTLSRLLIQLGNRQNLMSAYTKLRGKMPKQYVSAVRACIKADLPVEFRYQYLTTPHFPYKKTISASELECYFRCPYRHFLQYGLGVKEKENILPQKSNFGSFEHELLQKFVSGRDLRAAKEQDVENFIVQTFEDIAGKYYDKKILSQKQFVKYLKNESRLILKNVVYEQKNSDFRPILLEKEILLPISDNLLLKGFVDRVDRCGDYFRILDYKTGQTGSVKNDLFYGKKLQLLLYAGAQWKELGLDCAGVYYFDCQTKYAGLGSSKKLFKGLTKQDENVLFKSDTRLFDEEFKSDILGVSRKAHPKKGEFPYKGGNLEENLSSLVKYAYDVSKLAISEMTDGFVGAKPFTGACTHCPYLSVCRHGKADGKRGALKKKSKDAREEDVQ